MPNFDREILIRNIKKLMDDNGITQAVLAEILDMSQPNVSKALSAADKKNFTLDQVAGIAKHFRISIDTLIGNQQAVERDASPRAAAEYFTRLIEHGDLKAIKHSVEEHICEPYWNNEGNGLDSRQYKKNIDYFAFYFPEYWHIPDYLSGEAAWQLSAEMEQCGNKTMHEQTNRFFRQFLQIYNLYKQDSLEEETYRTVVADLLSHLRD